MQRTATGLYWRANFGSNASSYILLCMFSGVLLALSTSVVHKTIKRALFRLLLGETQQSILQV